MSIKVMIFVILLVGICFSLVMSSSDANEQRQKSKLIIKLSYSVSVIKLNILIIKGNILNQKMKNRGNKKENSSMCSDNQTFRSGKCRNVETIQSHLSPVDFIKSFENKQQTSSKLQDQVPRFYKEHDNNTNEQSSPEPGVETTKYIDELSFNNQHEKAIYGSIFILFIIICFLITIQ